MLSRGRVGLPGIYSLPRPIMEVIFLYALGEVELDGLDHTTLRCEYTSRRWCLSAVCQDWQMIFTSTRRLWSTIIVTPRTPEDVLTKWLKRSGNLKLYLYLLGRRGKHSQGSMLSSKAVLAEARARIFQLVEIFCETIGWENSDVQSGLLRRTTFIYTVDQGRSTGCTSRMESDLLATVLRKTKSVNSLKLARRVHDTYSAQASYQPVCDQGNMIWDSRNYLTMLHQCHYEVQAWQSHVEITNCLAGEISPYKADTQIQSPPVVNSYLDIMVDTTGGLPLLPTMPPTNNVELYDGQRISALLKLYSQSLEGLTISNMHIKTIYPGRLQNLTAFTLASCQLGSYFFRSFFDRSPTTALACPHLSVVTLSACKFDSLDFMTFIRGRCISDSGYDKCFSVVRMLVTVVVIMNQDNISTHEMKELLDLACGYAKTLSIRVL